MELRKVSSPNKKVVVTTLDSFEMRILTFSCLVQALLALQYGDRVSTLLQAVHRGWKTPWVDISIHQMPRFRTPDSTILHVSLPHEDENGPEMKLNPQEDVKFSITFDKNKLIVPWTVLFDASKRRTLQKLVVTFSHDEFQILKVNYETVCKLFSCRLVDVTLLMPAHRWTKNPEIGPLSSIHNCI